MAPVRTPAILLALALVAACDNKTAATPDAAPSAASVTAVATAIATAPSAAAPVASASAAPKPPPESIACQHVLIAYKGAKNAPPNVTRTKAQAKARAE